MSMQYQRLESQLNENIRITKGHENQIAELSMIIKER
jgi:hypothetical protein